MMDEGLREIWEKNVDVVRGRVQAVGHFLETGQGRDAALESAHNLCGYVGMFGFLDASENARNLETLMRSSAPSAADLDAEYARLQQNLPKQVQPGNNPLDEST